MKMIDLALWREPIFSGRNDCEFETFDMGPLHAALVLRIPLPARLMGWLVIKFSGLRARWAR